MSRLHIFNPDTDYALASDSPYYTAPAHVVSLRKENALLPALYADKGDAIIIMDRILQPIDTLRFHDVVSRKAITVLTPEEASEDTHLLTSYIPEPWGWNRQIRRWLLELSAGRSMPGMPSEEDITNLRNLSHRRTTIAFFRELSGFLDPEIEIPQEITLAEDGISAFHLTHRLFFKAPWSSSGRGVILTDDLEEKHVAPWLRGIIRRQGSVMMEKAYDRKLDFATEWVCRDNKARFIGYSVFNVSRRGKYQYNRTGSQQELLKVIETSTDRWNPDIFSLQQKAIEKIIAPYYSGPLGIDMLVTDSGAINPCVEINLRHTMGMIELLK